MKNIIKIFIIALTVVFIGYSCDKIEPPYKTQGGITVTDDTIRTVLLEDFTGHECVNCPQAHKIAADLKDYYGDRLVVVAIHAGFFAKPKPAPFDYDFRTPEGNALAAQFALQTTPIGMVNRVKQSNGGYLVDRGAFATEVSKQIDSLPEKPDLYIALKPQFNSSDSTVNVNAEITFLKDMPQGKYNFCIMVIEDDIVAAQKNNDPTLGNTPEILDYHHKHVLRGMITSVWGDEIIDGTPANGQQIQKSYSGYKLGADRVPDHCKLVAFVYHASGPEKYRIIQARETNLK